MSDKIVRHTLVTEIPEKAVLEYLSWYAGFFPSFHDGKEMGHSSDVVRGLLEG